VSRLVILGAGGHGAVVADAAELMQRWSTIVFLDDKLPAGENVVGHDLVGDRSELPQLIGEEDTEVFVAVGDNMTRLQLCLSIEQQGARLATVVHPHAHVSRSATIGEGTILCAGAIVNARISIASCCIINTGATIDHDCNIGTAVHISPGAVLAGGVTVEDLAWVGMGATINDGLRIGEGAIVGASAAVINNVQAGSKVVGVPARPIAS